MPVYPPPAASGGAPTDADYWVGTANGSLSAERILTTVRKTADETVNNSTAVQDDDHLVLAVGANETWEIDLSVLYESSTAADLRHSFSVPASATISGVAVGVNASGTATNVNGDLTTVSAWRGNGAAAIQALYIKAIVRTAGTAGNVVFRWAQQTQEVSDTKVLTGSVLTGKLVA